MQKWRLTLLVMATACVMAGCSKFNLPDTNTVSVQKDGSIKQIIVEQFERNYYDVEELTAMAQEKIAEFNNGTENVVCDAIEAKDGKIVVEMTYHTGMDYSEFNNRELFSGTVAEATTQGYSLKDAVTEDGTDISEEQLAEVNENHVVVIQTKEGEELDVEVYGKILYTSGNIILSGKKAAYIAPEGEDMLSYIIFQ